MEKSEKCVVKKDVLSKSDEIEIFHRQIMPLPSRSLLRSFVHVSPHANRKNEKSAALSVRKDANRKWRRADCLDRHSVDIGRSCFALTYYEWLRDGSYNNIPIRGTGSEWVRAERSYWRSAFAREREPLISWLTQVITTTKNRVAPAESASHFRWDSAFRK